VKLPPRIVRKKYQILATFGPQKSYIGQGWSRTPSPKSAFSDLFSQNFALQRRLLAVGMSELVPTPELVKKKKIRIGRRERGKSDSNTPEIIHLGPEKSYLRTRLRNFWPQKYYSRTRISEIFALKNPIFRTIPGWSFTGPLQV
jgi:hypothetical protein